MKFLSYIILITSLSLSLFAQEGQFQIVKNKVEIIRGGQSPVVATRGAELKIGDRVKTDKDSYAKILMNDGNILQVGPETEFVLKNYNTKAGDYEESNLEVVYGRLRSSLKKKYDGKSSQFNVTTEAAVMGVRGTDFISFYKKATSASDVVVFTGKVEAQSFGPNGELLGKQLVTKGQSVSVLKGAAPKPPVNLSPEQLKNLDTLSSGPDAISSILDPLGAAAGAAALVAAVDSEDKEEGKDENLKQAKAEDKGDDQFIKNIELKVGSTGGSLSYAKQTSNYWRMKIDAYNTFNYEYTDNEKAEIYTANLDFKGLGFLAEYDGPIFDYLIGFYFTNNKIKIDGSPLGNEQVGDTSYNFTSGNKVEGDGEFNSIAPYLGLAFRIPLPFSISLKGDIGAMYVGEFKVNNLNYSGPTVVSPSDVDKEILEIEENMNDLKVFPVVRLGFQYTF